MKHRIKNLTYIILMFSLLQGCAGTRNSYTSLLESSSDDAVLHVSERTITEILAVGDGLPGWWGYYPWVMTSTPDVASIDCKKARSLVPFREPGVIFGGTVCNLIAHEKGKITLFFGNKYNLSQDTYVEKVEVIVHEN